MKELTIEQKAQRYDEALKRAKECHIDGLSLHQPVKDVLEHVFPELAESEDERIRKELIRAFKSLNTIKVWNGIERTDIIAWLEKQGEQKPVFEIKTPEESLGIDSDTYNKIVDECIYGEQKPADVEEISFFEDFRKTDSEVEPKFKVGDWVVRGKTIAQILDIQEQYYIGLDIDGNDFTSSIFLSDSKSHLWTIQDAKDGDVLAVEPIEGYYLPFIAIYKEGGLDFFNSHCFIGFDGIFYNGDTSHSIDNIHPATKEQRETLFKTMHEARYEWDAEKKELKKIIDEEQIKKNLRDNSFRRMFEQKPAECNNSILKDKLLELFQRFRWYCKDKTPTNGDIIDYVDAHIQELVDTTQKPAWSEEDENAIHVLKDIVKNSNKINESIYTMPLKEKLYDWLKSLKDRVQPKQK